jgi:CRP/FNR family transcriptional regulator, cyclic AMP receptor protein
MSGSRRQFVANTDVCGSRPVDLVHVITLLDEIAEGKDSLVLGKGETICFAAGNSNAMYFIETGQVKLTAVSGSGKEAVLALLGPQELFSEGCPVGRSSALRMATALVPSKLLRIDRHAMLQAIQAHPDIRDQLMHALLFRNMALEEDLCNQLFNQSDKRLARVLLKLARWKERDDRGDVHLPAMSHAILAEMIGTTRAYTNRAMVRFQRMGLIEYTRCFERHSRLIVRPGRLIDTILDSFDRRRC